MRQTIFVLMTCLASLPAHSEEIAMSTGAATPSAAVAASVPFRKDLERGYRLKEQKRSAEAVAVFSAVLSKDPANHAALTELGYLHAGLKHYNSAAKYFRAASAQDPANMRLRMDLGYAEQALKRYDAAAEEFRIVGAHQGEFQDQAQKALAAISSVPAVSQEGAAQRRLREQGYAALNRGDKDAAAKSFEAAVANDPTDAPALKQLGFINFDAGKLAAAAANFEAVRALTPNDYFVALQLGYTYERLQKRDQAREAFVAAMASGDAKIHGAAQAALQSSGGPGAPAPSSSL